MKIYKMIPIVMTVILMYGCNAASEDAARVTLRDIQPEAAVEVKAEDITEETSMNAMQEAARTPTLPKARDTVKTKVKAVSGEEDVTAVTDQKQNADRGDQYENTDNKALDRSEDAKMISDAEHVYVSPETGCDDSTARTVPEDNNTENRAGISEGETVKAEMPAEDEAEPDTTAEPEAETVKQAEQETEHIHTGEPVTETIYHEPVIETIKVIDHEAWDEIVEKQIPITEDVFIRVATCRMCGAAFESEYLDEAVSACHRHILDVHDNACGYGLESSYHKTVQTGTETVTEVIHHEEEFHYEQVVTAEGWSETVVTGYRCTGCGKQKN